MATRRAAGHLAGATTRVRTHSENIAPCPSTAAKKALMLNCELPPDPCIKSSLKDSSKNRNDENAETSQLKRCATFNSGIKGQHRNTNLMVSNNLAQVSTTDTSGAGANYHRRALKEKSVNTTVQPLATRATGDAAKSSKSSSNVVSHEQAKCSADAKHTTRSPKESLSVAEKASVSPPPPPSKKRRSITRVTNPMVELNAISAADFYVEKTDLPDGVPDIDKKLVGDANCEANYAHGVFLYLREREVKFSISSYIKHQPEMSTAYRGLLIDWMVEIQEGFEFNHETLYLAVKIVDRYLARRVVSKARLQLLGATAMLIAAKLDERIPPTLEEFAYVCADAYTNSQIIEMERTVLIALDFDLSMPLSYTFLRRYCRSVEMDMREMTLARFILECSLLDYSMVTKLESHVAAASLLLALDILGKQWNATLTYYSGYEARELHTTRDALNKFVQAVRTKVRDEGHSMKSIIVKYSSEIFYNVANVEFPSTE